MNDEDYEYLCCFINNLYYRSPVPDNNPESLSAFKEKCREHIPCACNHLYDSSLGYTRKNHRWSGWGAFEAGCLYVAILDKIEELEGQ